MRDRVVLITGASSGIGQACADGFATAGARLIVAARRIELLEELAPQWLRRGASDVKPIQIDVRDSRVVDQAIATLQPPWDAIEVLINNAGLSRGLDPLHEGQAQDWEEMIDTNIRGLLAVDRAVVPGMVSRGRGTVVHIGSIAGRQVYPSGNVYCATKHAVRALTEGLRLDVLGSGVRVCSVDPGMVETEFSEVRFRGDEQRATAVYRGMTPLSAADVAEVVLFCATRPAHVTLADVLVLPTDQASATAISRKPETAGN